MAIEDGKLSIVIVNWNSGNQLSEALQSIAMHHSGVVAKVIVVDNNSSDDSARLAEFIHSPHYATVHIRNTENRGFAAACNQGAKHAESEFILFLNPDTALFEDSLPAPIKFMSEPANSSIAICGIRLVGVDGALTSSAANFPTLKVMAGKILGLARVLPSVFPPHLLTSAHLKESRPVDQIIGAFFLIRRAVFESCAGFDEGFFVYFEEVDLSFRVMKKGFSSYYLHQCCAFHKGGGCSDQVKASRLFYSLRSRLRYAKKHYSFADRASMHALTIAELPLRLLRALAQGAWADARDCLSAYCHLARSLVRR